MLPEKIATIILMPWKERLEQGAAGLNLESLRFHVCAALAAEECAAAVVHSKGVQVGVKLGRFSQDLETRALRVSQLRCDLLGVPLQPLCSGS